MARKKGLKKRVWFDDEKRTICAQAFRLHRLHGAMPLSSNLRFDCRAVVEREPNFQVAKGSPVHAEIERVIRG